MTKEQEGLKGERGLRSLMLLHNPDAQSSVRATRDRQSCFFRRPVDNSIPPEANVPGSFQVDPRRRGERDPLARPRSSPMQFAIQGRLRDCLPGQRWPLLELASELGIAALELQDDPQLDAGQLSEIQRRLTSSGIRPVSMYAYAWSTAAEEAKSKAALDQACRSMDRAKNLGAEMIVLLNHAPSTGASVADVRRSFAHSADLLVPEVQRRGLQVNFNNPGGLATYFGQSAYLKQLCEQYAPHARMTFDIANWMLAGESVHDAIDRLAPWISMVHIKDWTIQAGSGSAQSKARGAFQRVKRMVLDSPLQGLARSVGRFVGLRQHLPAGSRGMDGTWYRGAIPGQGILDQRAILSHLHRIGFRGHLCLEYEGQEDLTTAIRQSAHYMQVMLKEVFSQTPAPMSGPASASDLTAGLQAPEPATGSSACERETGS